MEKITPQPQELSTQALEVSRFALTEFCLSDLRDLGITEIRPNIDTMREALDFLNEGRDPIDPNLAFIGRTTALGARGRDIRWPARRDTDMSPSCYDISALTNSEATPMTIGQLAEELGTSGVKTICELDLNPQSSSILTMEGFARAVLMNRRPARPTQLLATQGMQVNRGQFSQRVKRLSPDALPFEFIKD